MIFTLSNRDLFLVASAGSKTGAARLRDEAAERFENGPYSISRHLYRYRDGVFSVFERRAP